MVHQTMAIRMTSASSASNNNKAMPNFLKTTIRTIPRSAVMALLAAAGVRFHHVPEVLYHWRQHEASTASNAGAKPYAHDAGARAVEDHLRAAAGGPALGGAIDLKCA
mgnify:CR=1 FL=1